MQRSSHMSLFFQIKWKLLGQRTSRIDKLGSHRISLFFLEHRIKWPLIVSLFRKSLSGNKLLRISKAVQLQSKSNHKDFVFPTVACCNLLQLWEQLAYLAPNWLSPACCSEEEPSSECVCVRACVRVCVRVRVRMCV